MKTKDMKTELSLYINIFSWSKRLGFRVELHCILPPVHRVDDFDD